MYARLLFVVVGISGPVLIQTCFGFYHPLTHWFPTRALASQGAADIRLPHESSHQTGLRILA
jgi:hypothetical protein